MDFNSNTPTQAFGEGGFTGAQDQTPRAPTPAYTPAQQNLQSLTTDLGTPRVSEQPGGSVTGDPGPPATGSGNPADLGPGFAQAGQVSSAGTLPAGTDFYNTPTSGLNPASWMTPPAQAQTVGQPAQPQPDVGHTDLSNPGIASLVQILRQAFRPQVGPPTGNAQANQALNNAPTPGNNGQPATNLIPGQPAQQPTQPAQPSPGQAGHDAQQQMQRQQALFAAPNPAQNPYGTGIPQPHRIANASNSAYGNNGQLGLEDMGNSGLSQTDNQYLAGLSYYYNPMNYSAWENAWKWGVPGVPSSFPGSMEPATNLIPGQTNQPGRNLIPGQPNY